MISRLVPPKNCAVIVRDVQSLAEQARQNRDQRKENRAGKGQPRHREVEEIRRRFARTHARDVAAVFLQIIRDLRGLKLRRDPEIAEEENHRGREKRSAATRLRAWRRCVAQSDCS